MLPKKEEDVINIFALGLIINALMSFFLLILVLLLGEQIALLLNDKELRPLLYFVPISVFLFGVWNVLNFLIIEKSDIKIWHKQIY